MPHIGEPLAYHFTFACYGSRLHGDERGTVDRFHHGFGEPTALPSTGRHEQAAARQSGPAYTLDDERCAIVLRGLLDSVARLGATCHAIHVRQEHVHVVMTTERDPETVLAHMKARATTALKLSGIDGPGERKRWARHGSIGRLWRTESLAQAIDYVLHQQGEPIAMYPAPGDGLQGQVGTPA